MRKGYPQFIGQPARPTELLTRNAVVALDRGVQVGVAAAGTRSPRSIAVTAEGSFLVIADVGVTGAVVSIATSGRQLERLDPDTVRLTVEAGENWD